MLPEADAWHWPPALLATWNAAAAKVLEGTATQADVDGVAQSIRAAGFAVRYGMNENEKGQTKTMQTMQATPLTSKGLITTADSDVLTTVITVGTVKPAQAASPAPNAARGTDGADRDFETDLAALIVTRTHLVSELREEIGGLQCRLEASERDLVALLAAQRAYEDTWESFAAGRPVATDEAAAPPVKPRGRGHVGQPPATQIIREWAATHGGEVHVREVVQATGRNHSTIGSAFLGPYGLVAKGEFERVAAGHYRRVERDAAG